jgi:hypothetical protein
VRTSLRNVHCLSLVALLVCCSRAALAEPEGAEPDTQAAVSTLPSSARSTFESAERAFALGSYLEALRLFRAAEGLAPHPATRFNIAVCLERLGRWREAIVEYRAVDASETLGEAARRDASARATKLEQRLSLVIFSAARGGVLLVDGEPRCRSSCRASVDPGRRALRVETPSGVRELTAELAPGERLSISAPAEPAAPARVPKSSKVRSRAPAPTAVGWLGAGLAGAGLAGTVYFGLRTNSLGDEFDRTGSRDAYDDGRRARTFTNVSLSVAIVGAALFAADWLFLAPERTEDP